jgi:hypothetical protein
MQIEKQYPCVGVVGKDEPATLQKDNIKNA